MCVKTMPTQMAHFNLKSQLLVNINLFEIPRFSLSGATSHIQTQSCITVYKSEEQYYIV